MSSEMILIYASATALIALMVAFASHNRKTGWKKSRPTLLEALNDLYADLGVGSESPASSLSAPVVNAGPRDTDFSLQLVKLRGALGNMSTSPQLTPREAQRASEQLVISGSRR
jgi:hypothetical protein